VPVYTEPFMPSARGEPGPASSHRLLKRAQQGDADAVDALLARYGPRLRRWAAGRLPRWARDVADTNDLVQEGLLRTFRRIETIDADRPGGLQAYLRQAVMNGIRDELRRAHRQHRTPLSPEQPSEAPSPLEEAIGREAVGRYERALTNLRPDEREAVIARLEMGFEYDEIAELVGKPSAAAARMAVQRALVKLAEIMRNER
jgi:RNA polymerase sigma factor (sigma-70 family)